jgi:hypothetical protein
MKIQLQLPFQYVDLENENMNKLINIYMKRLLFQKTYGLIVNVDANSYRDNISKILLYFRNEIDILEKETINIDVERCLSEFDAIANNDGKEGLLKRIDIYSFGAILLQNIYYFWLRNRADNDDLIIKDADFKYYLFRLYSIAYYCCYLTKNIPDIDLIVEYYKLITQIYGYTIIEGSDMTSSILRDLGKKYINKIPEINTIHYEQLTEFKNNMETERFQMIRKMSESSIQNTPKKSVAKTAKKTIKK